MKTRHIIYKVKQCAYWIPLVIFVLLWALEIISNDRQKLDTLELEVLTLVLIGVFYESYYFHQKANTRIERDEKDEGDKSQ